MLVLWTGKFTTQSRQTDQSRGLHIQTQRYEQEKVTQGGIHDPGATTTSHVSLEASALSGGVEFELKEAAGGHGLLSSEPSVGVATANGSAFIKAEGLNKAVLENPEKLVPGEVGLKAKPVAPSKDVPIRG